MAIKKTDWTKPSRYSRGLKYDIRFDNRLKQYIIVCKTKRIFTDKSFKTPQDAKAFIMKET